MTGFDLSGVSDIRLGNNPVDVYLGGTKIWPRFSVLNFAYTGAVQSCELPAGRYKLQCWGAQGGSSPSDSTYGISSYAGGKGGYSEGIITLTSPTTVYVFVGGQPSTSSTNGGWNGGGGGSGTSTYGTPTTPTYGLGVSKVGRGGGSTDIALTTSTMAYSSYRTNRSSASLLSRFIVAGGGSGGGGALQRITTSTTSWETLGTIDASQASGTFNGLEWTRTRITSSGDYYFRCNFNADVNPFNNGDVLRITISGGINNDTRSRLYWIGPSTINITNTTHNLSYEVTWSYSSAPSGSYFRLQVWQSGSYYTGTVTIEKQVTTQTTTVDYTSRLGYAGGGVEGEGYEGSGGTLYYGSQNTAGNRGEFGLGANQVGTSYRYVSPCGGGGWYGGGNGYNNNSTNNSISLTGGGSGFVNTSDNSSYRPTGYTGAELDSGTTYDGTQTFEAVNGGTETGHEGNGYARITRL